jgi:2,3-bisphosphoglycerate-dependent phosphoglycerate mutase
MELTRLLILTRHGQSDFNARDLFTGWADPPLTARGLEEVEGVAARLQTLGLRIDAAFCSSLGRARRSAEVILERLGAAAPLIESAALNERDYGELSGLNKDEAAQRWGADQVRRWRRGYLDRPPGGESLRDIIARVLPFYIQQILPATMRDQNTLVVGHGNSVRALIYALEQHTPESIPTVELATGEIRLYELAADTTVIRRQAIAASGAVSAAG